ncbi:MAG TPA: M20/M25/M40 family metallo-hydrolase [Myxococcota bacterium]|jgi:glutamate carboxypeptidase|nr:M20/M25/M40 family metallo-hydrolase [Myxococcota bacterium]
MLSETERALARWLDDRAADMEADVRALVAVDSYSARPEGVARAARLLAPELAALGLAVEERRTDGSGPHLVARKEGTSPRVALIVHLDTVFPEPVPYAPDPAGAGRVRGSGVCDAKGGAVVALWALRALRAAGLWEPLAATVLYNGDEEVGSRWSRPIVEEVGRDAAWALVYEPGFVAPDDPGATTIVVRRKGVSRYRVSCRGRAAHAGNRYADGVSAVEELAHLVIAATARTDLERELTVNVGLVQGGTAANTVPEHAEAAVDVRFRRVEDDDAFFAWLRAEAARAHAVHSWQARAAETAVERVTQRPPMEPTEASLALARHFVATGADLGQRLVEQSRGGGSDAALTAGVGTPSVDGLGAVGGAMHQRDEWYDPRSLAARATLSAVAIARLAGLGA